MTVGSERLEVREPAGAELRARPLAHGEQSLGRLLLAGLRIEHEGVRVAEHDRAVESAQRCDDLGRLGAALDGVAETDDLIDRLALEVGDHRLERDRVAVHVGDERGPHRARLRDGDFVASGCGQSFHSPAAVCAAAFGSR